MVTASKMTLQRIIQLLTLLEILVVPKAAHAELVVAEPLSPIVVRIPADGPPIEAQVVLQVVIDATGGVESALEISRLPRDAPDTFAQAAIEAVRKSKYSPSLRDGRPIRSRIEYVVVFHPTLKEVVAGRPVVPAASGSKPPVGTATTLPAARLVPNESPLIPTETVDVRGTISPSPRGLGDVRIDREMLTSSPRQQTSEMLSTAPGFFVDHEDGEGLGNDVYLRGFDLDHGSGIEMKLGEVPINIPLHIHGQGYADANFIIPEVVRSIRVLEGPYDPRQGDSAIVGSAAFDLGVPERGYQLKTTYGSFAQARLVGIAAPREMNDDTFAAVSLRETQGFGANRASKSASLNAQYSVDLGERDHVRVLTTAYAATEDLPGVVRQDDIDAGRIGYYGSYPFFNSYFPGNCSSASCSEPAQGVQSSRIIAAAKLDHSASASTHFEVASWIMSTRFLSRQNYTGALDSSNLQPTLASLGDLWQLTNVETAWGIAARVRAAPIRIGDSIEVLMEPGVSWRAGHTSQSKDLVDPADLAPWDYRESYGLDTIDIGGYIDIDLRLWKRLRVSGGARVDFLDVSVTDNLAGVVPPIQTGALQGATTNVVGVAPGPRVTVGYEFAPGLTPVVSAGNGFRSLDAGSLTRCNTPAVHLIGTPSSMVPPCVPGSPYSRVTSFEGGFRSEVGQGRFTTILALFQTDVANELVFDVSSGGLTTENASTRTGVVGSFLARPTGWLLASSALSVQTATFNTLVAGTSHYVPNVPAVLWRTDVNAHGELLRIRGMPLTGRFGLGYTLLGGRRVNDWIVSPTNNVLNALASLRYRFAEIGVDMYNVLGLAYADEEEYYISNWSLKPGQQPASAAVHLVPAPPRTVLATATLTY
jgi:hypothetical protein